MKFSFIILTIFFIDGCSPKSEDTISLVCHGDSIFNYQNTLQKINNQYNEKESKSYKLTNYLSNEGKNEWMVVEDGKREWKNENKDFLLQKIEVSEQLIRFEMNSSYGRNTEESSENVTSEEVEINRISGNWTRRETRTNYFYKNNYQIFSHRTEGICEKIRENKI